MVRTSADLPLAGEGAFGDSLACDSLAGERDAQIRAILREIKELRDEYVEARVRYLEHVSTRNTAQAEEEDAYMKSLLWKMKRRKQAIDALTK